MIECILAWITLSVGIYTQNPMWFIASGVYAISTNIRAEKE